MIWVSRPSVSSTSSNKSNTHSGLGEAPLCEMEDNIARVVPRIKDLLEKIPTVTLALENMVSRAK